MSSTTLPIKAAVKKYILANFGPAEPIKFDRKHLTGQLMLNLDIELGHSEAPEEMKASFLQVEWPLRHVENHYQNQQSRIHAGNYFFSIFSLAMLTWVDAQVQAGMSAWISLEGFLNSYDIHEEEYSLESAYRYWQKYKPLRVQHEKNSLSA